MIQTLPVSIRLATTHRPVMSSVLSSFRSWTTPSISARSASASHISHPEGLRENSRRQFAVEGLDVRRAFAKRDCAGNNRAGGRAANEIEVIAEFLRRAGPFR
jgi:hypothetical protein